MQVNIGEERKTNGKEIYACTVIEYDVLHAFYIIILRILPLSITDI